MGIKNLWEALQPIQEDISLLEFAVTEGLLRRNGTHRTLVVGVDASIWIDTIQAALSNRTALHSHSGPNAAIFAFFCRLCKFLSLPITLVFVFDGPGRPTVKRGHRVSTGLWIDKPIKDLISIFGFIHLEAPGEAEAELAAMNSHGLIDVVLTEDSDAFVFGAQCVIRSLRNSQNKPDTRSFTQRTFARYQACDIEHDESTKFTPDALVLFALLNKNDYSDGIQGCGLETSKALCALGFGETLHQSLTLNNNGQLQSSALQAWRADVQHELRTNAGGLLQSRMSRVADAIPIAFPEPETVDLFLHPLTSWTGFEPSPTVASPINTDHWLPKLPQLYQLSKFCRDYFRVNENALIKMFEKHVVAGFVFRCLIHPMAIYNPSTTTVHTMDFKVVLVQRCLVSGPVMPCVSLKTRIHGFAAAARLGSQSRGLNDVSVTVPQLVFDAITNSEANAQQIPTAEPTIPNDIIDLTNEDSDDEAEVIDLTNADSEDEVVTR